MSPERWRRIRGAIEIAIEGGPEQRTAYLAELRADDPELYREVAVFLNRDWNDSFLEHPAVPAVELAAGTRLGPYEIQAAAGAGGMGQVYRAVDTRLNRTVAIKVLPPHVALDPELKRRFEREAKTISSLNHPHICTLHEFDCIDGVDLLVMEYLEGETLADRLERGALPLGEAIRYALEVAEALEKAHRQGITHRDLKPGNVMLTDVGAKLLDFGLAKPRKPETASGVETDGNPTTARGTLLGTLPYMAPEQLEGRDADARTDVFAFGTVIYEMVTGVRAFDAETDASLIAAILEHEPIPVSNRQPLIPSVLDRIVAKCLAKEPAARWQSMRDLADTLRWLPETAPSTAFAETTPESSAWRWRGPAALAVGLLVAVTAVNWWPPRPTPVISDPTRVAVSVAPAVSLGFPTAPRARPPSATAMVLSNDGRQLIFSASGDDGFRLYRRRFEDAEARPMQGTEGARGPFLSPDEQWVGYWAAGELRKVPVDGGPPVTICAVPRPTSIGWPGSLGYALVCCL